MGSHDETAEAERTTAVVLPERLATRIETRLPRTEFESTSEYVTFVLEEVLARVEDRDDDAVERPDEEEVESRLRSLGYLEE